MRKSKFFTNVTTLFAVLVSVVFVSCGALTDAAGDDDGHGSGNEVMITIKLPQITPQSTRSLTADEVTELRAATTSYRVTFRSNYKTIVRESASSETSFSAFFYVGTNVGVIVECLNKNGQVIVRTVEKNVKIRSSNNTVTFKLSEDGTKIVPEPDPTPTPEPVPPAPPAPGPEPVPPPQPVTVRITFEAGYYITNTQPQTWKEMGMDARPPQAGEKNPGAAISEAMTLNGFAFKGWVLKDSYNPSATSYSDQPIITAYPSTASTLVGIWEENPPNTFTLSYSWGDGVAVAQGTLPSQATCTAGSPENVEIPANVMRTGYEFLGWSESQNAQMATYASGGTTQITISQDTTLYAVWSLITYTIKFSANGGSDSQDDLQFTVEDTNKSLPTANEVTFTPPQGKAFKHWATSNSGLTTNLEFIIALLKTGATSNLEMNGNDITIYAVWEDSVRTVLYSDGTLIINELPANRRNDVGVTEEYEAMEDDGSNYEFTGSSLWENNNSLITYVEIGSSIRPTSTAYWFTGMSNCVSIDLTNLDTSRVTNMSCMFNGCSALINLNVDNFNTSNVTAMDGMFGVCSKLTSLDLSNFDTSKVTTMYNMFSASPKLADITFGNSFDTVQVTSMGNMFMGCTSLRVLDLSNFNTSNVRDLEWMFKECSNLETIYASSAFVSYNIPADDMFAGCTRLVGGNNTQFNSYIVDATYARIDNPPDEPGYFTDKP